MLITFRRVVRRPRLAHAVIIMQLLFKVKHFDFLYETRDAERKRTSAEIFQFTKKTTRKIQFRKVQGEILRITTLLTFSTAESTCPAIIHRQWRCPPASIRLSGSIRLGKHKD